MRLVQGRHLMPKLKNNSHRYRESAVYVDNCCHINALLDWLKEATGLRQNILYPISLDIEPIYQGRLLSLDVIEMTLPMVYG